MGDLIYREDAIVALTQSADYIGDALDRLCKVPTVDAKPVVHGRWLSKSEEGIYGPGFCSICDFELVIHNTPYCPNCGAQMEV